MKRSPLVAAVMVGMTLWLGAGVAVDGAGARSPQPSAQVEIGRLRARVEQLEEQLVDLRVVIGTLQSLARAPRPAGGGGYGSQGGGGDAGRLAILETQIRALTAQVERLADRLRAIGGRGGAAPPSGGVGRFGSTTVQPRQPQGGGDDDRIGRFIRRDHQPNSTRGVVGWGNGDRRGGQQDGAQFAYEQAYAYWLQRNFGAAEKAFVQFLADHANHKLAGNAQYWLGEALYAQGKYNQAAKAFLKGYQTYGSSPLAPDSLLKLAMSLDRLGHKRAACSSLGELGQRFPRAPRGVLKRVRSEQQRLGC